MVFTKQNGLVLSKRLNFVQFLCQEPLQKELFLHPDRHGRQERSQSLWSKCCIGSEQTLELQHGLVVKGYVIEGGKTNTTFIQAVTNGVNWKAGVVFFPSKPL